MSEVLLLGGKPTEAAGALRQALACFERKGNLVAGRRARKALEAMRLPALPA